MMTERYASFISSSDSKSDTVTPSFPDPRTVGRASIENPIPSPSSATHQQAALQHPLYDPFGYNPATDAALWTHPNDPAYSPGVGALGFFPSGLATLPFTTSNNNSEFTSNDLPFSAPIPRPGSQDVPSSPPPALHLAYDQTNNIPAYNQYTVDPPYLHASNPGFQPNTWNTSPTYGIPWMRGHSTTPFPRPDVHRISPRTDAHPLTLYRQHDSSLSTPDRSTVVSVHSSGSSPSFSHHHRTPSSVSSFNLYTPDHNPHHLESYIQPPPSIAHHTSSQQRLTGIRTQTLTSPYSAQNALRPSTKPANQPKVAPSSSLQVPMYPRIAPMPPGHIKPQKEPPLRRETKRVRRESTRNPLDSSRNLTTHSLPAGTVHFTEPLTPTTVKEGSFNTSSRKVHERSIARASVNSEAGFSIAPKAQEELRRSHAPTHAPTHVAEHISETGHALLRRRRNSKEAKGGAGTSAPRLRTSIRSPPTGPQNSTTLPTSRKRRKRGTTDSNSSSNSSKTPTGRSRNNSQEEQKVTSLSQQTSDSNGRTRSVRKNSGRAGRRTSAAVSAPRVGPASAQMTQSPSRVPVPVSTNRPLASLGGRSNPITRTLTTSRSGSTQSGPVPHRKGSTHSPGYQTGRDATTAHPKDPRVSSAGAQQRVPPVRNQSGSGDLEWMHHLHSAVDYESLMSQTLPEMGNFNIESDADDSCGWYNAGTSRYPV